MAKSSESLVWLPPLLVVAGLFFLIAGAFSDGPDRIGGIVFGSVCLMAAGAILYRRARDNKSE
jgi:hypothetical protein